MSGVSPRNSVSAVANSANQEIINGNRKMQEIRASGNRLTICRSRAKPILRRKAVRRAVFSER